jgi:hypothetical protein
VGKASSVKGAKAERDIASWLSERFGMDIKRMLGAGRAQDVGDLHGLTGFTVQIANRANLGDTLRYKPLDCEVQQGHGGTLFGVTLMKLPPQPGGKPQEWRAVMTLEQFAEVYEVLYSILEGDQQ